MTMRSLWASQANSYHETDATANSSALSSDRAAALLNLWGSAAHQWITCESRRTVVTSNPNRC